jgi:hypothetical protein
MLAVGFTPVFTAFAAQDAGLIAAGRATSCTPGGLLTDSPVAAYYSGKPPSRIAGSQALPDDRPAAMSWLQAHGFDALVLENISYYHATAVFPELARGDSTPPFAALGSHHGFHVEAGKDVQAYTLGTTCHERSLFGDVSATLPMTPGPGKTAPLAKGVTLSAGAASAAGEGMGFGLPIVHYSDGWVYPRSYADADLSTAAASVWRRTFELDEMGGDALHAYAFVPVASRGEIEVTYSVDASGVSVEVKPIWLAAGYTEVGVLNEQASSFDDFAAAGQRTLVGPAFGRWVPVTGGWARLRSGRLGVEWSAGSLVGATLQAGRESVPPDFDWAGLDYILPAPFAGAAYRITVQEAR